VREIEEASIDKSYEVDGWSQYDIEEWRSNHWSLYDTKPTVEIAVESMRHLHVRYGGQWRIVEVQTTKEVVDSIGDEEIILEIFSE
jgi:predicted RecB family nuclease